MSSAPSASPHFAIACLLLKLLDLPYLQSACFVSLGRSPRYRMERPLLLPYRASNTDFATACDRRKQGQPGRGSVAPFFFRVIVSPTRASATCFMEAARYPTSPAMSRSTCRASRAVSVNFTCTLQVCGCIFCNAVTHVLQQSSNSLGVLSACLHGIFLYTCYDMSCFTSSSFDLGAREPIQA